MLLDVAASIDYGRRPSKEARSRAYKIVSLLVERYLTSGVIEIELLGESSAVVTMVKTELQKIKEEIVSNDYVSPKVACRQPGATTPNKAARQRHPKLSKSTTRKRGDSSYQPKDVDEETGMSI